VQSIQTRDEDGLCLSFLTMKSAVEHIAQNPSAWKLSFGAPPTRIRLIRSDNGLWELTYWNGTTYEKV